MNDFVISKLCFYNGPSYYLDKRAMVFNLAIDPDGPAVSHYEPHVISKFPGMAENLPRRVADLFAEVLIKVLQMDINLFINKYDISRDGDDYVIAVEYLDKKTSEDCVEFVSKWFNAMNEGIEYPFDDEFKALQADFDKSLFGGPTIYSLVEAGLKRGIPVSYLFEENVFQWGYGSKNIRGRSTTFHIDGIKDTEFTMFKDMVKDFLLMCGMPTPVGKNCMTEDEVAAEAEKLGYPVVVKPLAGHKGQGVTTGITSADEARVACRKIMASAVETGVPFAGAIVEKQIYGTDHRLLTVGGKFAAALQRIPAYVDGNGSDTIQQLIEKENATIVRLDNARSPLCKIKIDENLDEYLKLQNLTLNSVPQASERVYLRRVANISAGGVSINVTDKVHPKNVKLAEDIAKFFKVTCLGIDVLAEDITKPWNEGGFGIIEINAGPGVFMHLAPAIGESIDVPGKIMETFFPRPELSRIPIIVGNSITEGLSALIQAKFKEISPDKEFGSLLSEGIFFDGELFCKNESHDQNVKMLLRSPKLGFAVIQHTKDDIFDDGTFHEGADIAILENPHSAEKVMSRDLLPGGYLVEVMKNEIVVSQDGKEVYSRGYKERDNKDEQIMKAIERYLEDIVEKYER